MHAPTHTLRRALPYHHHPGAVPVLDIGGEVGAMVIYLAEDTPTGELEACPHDRPGARFHTGVHHRDIGGGSWVAVFPEVTGGRYDVLDDDGAVLAIVDVKGGTVAELDLR